ncbi:sulfotransferase [Halothece sp. PCC 7418]|uniref:sulfotransferase domain-containing protein n=1 Tax=Halothece sp. (strain PCC 7418) TaxID=65093 RepID=UPI0002A0616F|nr:sulfotransferase domain-containing protein [Halothece sp. PCC 7418]AFZ44900.1 sulfotransferase [Halothece sp. PCC 7418]
MQTLKSYIPTIIKNKLHKAGLTKGILKDKGEEYTADQKVILEAKHSLEKPPSVLFFTTHKCASSFISPLFRAITRNSNYNLKDYAGAIWQLGDNIDLDQEKPNFLGNFLQDTGDRLFFRRGEIYAPLRVPVDFPERHHFKHIFFLRDPRDVLVSAYYSFGFTHAWPKNSKARERYRIKREAIQQQTIDDYVISEAKNWLTRYSKYQELLETSDSYVYLKYDDFQSDTVGFIQTITNYLDISLPSEEIEQLASKASPIQSTKDETKHKRSGKSKQYLEELKPDTVRALNEKFSDMLCYWNFSC